MTSASRTSVATGAAVFPVVGPLLGLTLALAASQASCKKKEAPSVESDAWTGAAAEEPSPPVDHPDPNELFPGTENAFGLLLPREVRVDSRIEDVVNASTPAPPPAVLAYLEKRLRNQGVKQTPAGTVLDHAEARGVPGVVFWIRVGRNAATIRTDVEIRDVTPKPPPPLPDDPARWRAAGLKPNGALVDPSHTL